MFWFENPLVLLLIPVAAAALYYVFIADGKGSKRRRYAMFGSRLAVVVLLVVVFAQPFVVETTTVEGDERVQVLIDDSDSMEVFDDVGEEIAAGVEEEGVDVETVRIAEGDSSRLGDQLLSNAERDGSMLLISDGHVTDGRSLGGAAESARAMNTQVNVVNLTATQPEAYVEIHGPSKASEGVEESYEVCVDGVGLDEMSTSVTVDVDGETVFSDPLSGCEEFGHTFDSTGEYAMTAELNDGGEGLYERNTEFYKTVRVVERPTVLYVSGDSYPLLELLEQLYDVETASEVPSNLDDYYAVVMQNQHADDIGDTAALQEFVIEGNGLVVTGGPNAYDEGGYAESPIGDIVPVESGETGRSSNIVILLDISGTLDEELPRVQGVALDVIDSLGNENRVGMAFFTHQKFPNVVPMDELSTNRAELVDTVENIDPEARARARGTDSAVGLQAAEETLGGEGEIIMITDGLLYDRPPEAGEINPETAEEARRLNRQGINIHTVGIGEAITDAVVMRDLADIGGGNYYMAEEADRLRVLFGGEEREPDGDVLTIMDSGHFITDGVETSTDLPVAHDVSVKQTGRFLVATGDGDVAMASGRYGLGRVVSVTAHTGNGVLGGLLSDPDSMLMSRGVNWAIGDPERLATDVYDVSDTRVGETTEVSYRGSSRPDGDLEFAQTEEDEYVATVTPTEPGFQTAAGASYAVNYAEEYGGFGLSNSVLRAAGTTGGDVYQPHETAAIAENVRSHASEPRETQRDLSWMPLLAALLVYLTEVCLRRLHDVYGYEIDSIAKDAVEAVRSRT